MSSPRNCLPAEVLHPNCGRGMGQFGDIVMLNVRLSFAVYCVSVLVGSGAATRGKDVRSRLPPLESASKAVRRVFDVKSVRPLERVSFQSLRNYFSTRQQHNVDQFLRALDDLMAARNRVAERVGIRQEWWWPPDVGTDVHILMKNDPLTDRGSTPDEISISSPTLLDRKVEITVEDRYKEIARDSTDLGGTKLSKVTLVPTHGRWVIDDIVFTVQQYGKTNVINLEQLLASDTKELRVARQKIANRKVEIRTAQPPSRY
jgi:hypothetical protein